jgi:type II secretory pathway component PulC
MRSERRVFIVSVILCAFCMACGATQKKVEPSSDPPLIDESEHMAVVADKPEDTEFQDKNIVAGAPVAIRREDLLKVLSAGPAALLAQVVTEPVLNQGRFVGFRINGFPAGTPRGIDLKPGDVILLVNGKKIQRPENYFAVFQELRVAGELQVTLLRDDEEKVLYYPIVD